MTNPVYDPATGTPVTVTNVNPNGAALSVASAPVVPATDYISPIKRSGVLVYSTTQTGISASGNSGDLDLSKYDQVLLLVNLTALTGTSVQFLLKAKDNFAVYYNVYSPAALTAPGSVVGSVGTGLAQAAAFGNTAQVTWVCVAVTTATFTITLWGK